MGNQIFRVLWENNFCLYTANVTASQSIPQISPAVTRADWNTKSHGSRNVAYPKERTQNQHKRRLPSFSTAALPLRGNLAVKQSPKRKYEECIPCATSNSAPRRHRGDLGGATLRGTGGRSRTGRRAAAAVGPGSPCGRIGCGSGPRRARRRGGRRARRSC